MPFYPPIYFFFFNYFLVLLKLIIANLLENVRQSTSQLVSQ